MTQLLIYETAVPVSKARHADCSVNTGSGYAFSRKVNSVPLMAVEFPAAAPEYAIVFAGKDGVIMPSVILGMRGNENAYLDSDDGWKATYLPAFVRRYPFVFSASEGRQDLHPVRRRGLCRLQSRRPRPGTLRRGRKTDRVRR